MNDPDARLIELKAARRVWPFVRQAVEMVRARGHDIELQEDLGLWWGHFRARGSWSATFVLGAAWDALCEPR